MAQLVNRLPDKDKEMSLNPQYPHKIPGMTTHIYTGKEAIRKTPEPVDKPV